MDSPPSLSISFVVAVCRILLSFYFSYKPFFFTFFTAPTARRSFSEYFILFFSFLFFISFFHPLFRSCLDNHTFRSLVFSYEETRFPLVIFVRFGVTILHAVYIYTEHVCIHNFLNNFVRFINKIFLVDLTFTLKYCQFINII